MEKLFSTEDNRLKVFKLDNGYTFSSRKDVPVVEGNEKPDAVVVIARDHHGRLLVIREYRPIIGKYVWALPAGMVDEGEHVVEAAVREIHEETGLEVDRKAPIRYHTNTFVSPGWTDEIVAVVECYVKGELSNKFLEGDEDIQAFLMDPDDMTRAGFDKPGTPMSIWLKLSLL